MKTPRVSPRLKPRKGGDGRGPIGWKDLAALALSFSVLNGVLSAGGFWTSFGLNPLQYLGLTDLARISIYPLITFGGIYFVGVLVSYLFADGAKSIEASRRLASPKWLRGKDSLAAFIVIMVAALLGVFLPTEPAKWIAIAGLLSLAAFPLSNAPRVKRWLPETHTRVALLSALLLAPPLAYGIGQVQASLLVHDKSTPRVDVVRSKLSPPFAPTQRPLFVGYLGSFCVLYDDEKSDTFLVPLSADRPLALAVDSTLLDRPPPKW